MTESLNKFGGEWTEKKIDVFIKYLQAYLTIMSKQTFPSRKKRFKLLYFDGFAGSGNIDTEDNYENPLVGAAPRVIGVDTPTSFDMYYLVELDREKAIALELSLKEAFPQKKDKIFVANEDCNVKLMSLANYLQKPSNAFTRTLCFIDPFAMELKWSSIEALRDLHIDLWMLVPSGSINRMLARSSEIPDGWKRKLESSLGLPWEELYNEFYSESTVQTLFGPEKKVTKEEKIFDAIISCYQKQLKTVWGYVSKPLALKNSTGSTLFHFIFASRKEVAMKIANEIIKE